MPSHPRKKNRKSHNEQLKVARRIRSLIARDMQRMSSGEIHLQDVLESPERFSCSRLQVYALLSRAPGLGKKSAKKICLEVKVWPMDRTRDLDLYVREDIIKDLPPRARR